MLLPFGGPLSRVFSNLVPTLLLSQSTQTPGQWEKAKAAAPEPALELLAGRTGWDL